MNAENLESEQRPVIPIPRSGVEKGVEAIAIIGMIASFILLIIFYNQLPDKIPMHYGFGGKPDALSGKWAIVALPIVGLVMYVGLSLVRKIPHFFNYAWPITKDNAERMYTLAVNLITWIKMEVVLMFTYIQLRTVWIGMGWAKDLGILFLPVAIGAMAVTCIFFIVRMSKAK